MRLRNLKETIPYTIEDTLLDVQPHSLEEPFHWYAPPGSPCWIDSVDENGNNRKWRRGFIGCESRPVFSPKGIMRTYHVHYTVKRKPATVLVAPGLSPKLKPDSPEVRELLRQAGVFI